jgi:serine protease Do
LKPQRPRDTENGNSVLSVCVSAFQRFSVSAFQRFSGWSFLMVQHIHAPAAGFALSAAVSPAVTELVERVRPHVVQVRSESGGAGTGVIWRGSGAILTNDHVVAHARGKLHVNLADRRSFPARLLARNPRLDLALLQIDATGLPVAQIGDSQNLRVGELVFAIGHPWGLPWVTTAGIVSALGEVPVRDDGTTATYIRSDVRLAPGNSGGPLLNALGEVIGINAMIFGGDLAVAIPSHVASAWLALQPRERPTIGLSVKQAALPAGDWAGRTHGLLVVAVAAGGPAEQAGMLVDDILVDAAGQGLDTPKALLAMVDAHAPGELQCAVVRGETVIQIQLGLP